MRASRALLAVTMAILPLYTVRWRIGPIPTTLLENLIIATIGLYLIARFSERALSFHRTPLDLAIVVLLVSGAISVFVASDHRAALGLYRAYFLEPVALFYVMNDLLRAPLHFRLVIGALAAGTTAFSVANVVNFLIALGANRVMYGAPPSFLYTSSNEVAMFLEPPLALAAALILVSPSRADRWMGVAWAAFLLPALAATLSRGAFLAIAVFALLTVANLSKAARKPILITAGTGIALFVGVLLLGSHTPVVVHRLSVKALEYTSVARFELFGATLLILLQHPIFGVGLGGYRYVFNGFPEIYPHDIWLTFWVELGVLGLAAFAYIFIWLITKTWRELHRASGFERVLVWGAFGALVLWGVHGLFDSPYWKNDMSVEFWLMASFALRSLRNQSGAAILTAPAPHA